MASGEKYEFAVNKLIVPKTRKEYAIDLNGDGTVDNALGGIIGALEAQMLSAQTGIDEAVTGGSVVLLIEVQSTDMALKTAVDVGATVFLGKNAAMPPKFDGTDTFMIDDAQPPAKFLGKLNNTKFLSNPPITTKLPVSVTIKLPLIAGASPLSLTVNGAHVQFTTSATGLMSGEIHGSIKREAIDNGIIPAVATLLTERITADPNSSTTMTIKNLFDKGNAEGGNCTNPDNTMGVPNDNTITICEVKANSIIQNVLAPDVDIFNAAGAYGPSKGNEDKDSLSLGIAFTAVKASF